MSAAARIERGTTLASRPVRGVACRFRTTFDLALLPTPELFKQYFKPTFYYSKPAEGGTYRRNEASFGPETWLGLTGAVMFGVRQQALLGGAPGGAALDGGK